MARRGLFDPELRHESLFDDIFVLDGWFDPELIDTGVVPPVPPVPFIAQPPIATNIAAGFQPAVAGTVTVGDAPISSQVSQLQNPSARVN